MAGAIFVPKHITDPTRAGIETPKVVEQILKTKKAVQVNDSVRCSCVGSAVINLKTEMDI